MKLNFLIVKLNNTDTEVAFAKLVGRVVAARVGQMDSASTIVINIVLLELR